MLRATIVSRHQRLSSMQRGRRFSSLLVVRVPQIIIRPRPTNPPSATGIGYSISESFAQAGIARIIIIQRRPEVLAQAKKSLEAAYPNTKVETYAASQSDFPRMSEIIKSVGEIDVLVPCATYFSDALTPAKASSTEDIANYFTVNVVGVFHLVKEFLALPSTASGGPKSVLQVSSAAAQLYIPGASAYCASKAAANSIITHFAFDEPASNVKFFSFHPGSIYTPLVEKSLPKDLSVWEDGKSHNGKPR